MNKDTGLLLVIVAGVALLFWAMSKGFLGIGLGPTGLTTNPNTGVKTGTIITPQPTQNYSGFLAASTAPGVSDALNGVLSGVGNLFSGWFGGGSQQASQVGQAGNTNSPALSAQPSGPAVDPSAQQSVQNIGPIIGQTTSYDATTGSAFGWMDLAGDNVYDPSYSLQDPQLA